MLSLKQLGLRLLLLSGVTLQVHAMPPASADRLDAVAQRGAQVMPFNLEQTMHHFSKTQMGGIQQVVVKNPQNQVDLSAIQRHLSSLSTRFSAGDFSGPQSIHGQDMPGTKMLELNAQRIRFQYQDLALGGQIEMISTEPELILAIHQFLDAQLNDHARHAQAGMHAQHHP
jgi:hypothetical protein